MDTVITRFIKVNFTDFCRFMSKKSASELGFEKPKDVDANHLPKINRAQTSPTGGFSRNETGLDELQYQIHISTLQRKVQHETNEKKRAMVNGVIRIGRY